MTIFHDIKDCLSRSQALHLQKTSSPNIICTKVEAHWRSNKSLPNPFIVIILTPVPDGTLVTVAAGNDESPCGEIRNESAKVQRQVAKFNDLRFVGKSGRGKNFHITITVHSNPLMIGIVPRAIKVTVDGPRDARTPKLCDSKRKRQFNMPFPISTQSCTIHSPISLNTLFMHPSYDTFQRTSLLIPTFTMPIASTAETTASLNLHGSTDFKQTSSSRILEEDICKPKKRHLENTTTTVTSSSIWRPF